MRRPSETRSRGAILWAGRPGQERRRRGRVGAATCGAVVIAGVVLGGCTVDPSLEPVAPEAVAAIQTGVDEFLARADRHGQVRAVLIYRDGEPLLESYRGGAGEGDYWDTKSVTKSVMSALVGIAIDDGLISGVDATLGDLLPSYADAMTPEIAMITLEQVLLHTAGFAAGGLGEGNFASWLGDDWTRAVLQRRAADGASDGRFVYSDIGSFLLSAIVTEASGRSVLDYARETFFDPIGIDTDPAFEGARTLGDIPDAEFLDAYYGSGFAWPTDPQGQHSGDSSLKLRPRDLARIGELYLNGGVWDGVQVVSADWVERSTVTHVDNAGAGFGFGYQWWTDEVDDSPAYSARGWGGQLIEVVPDHRLVVVVATEFDDRDPPSLANTVSSAALAAMVAYAIAPHLP